MPTFKLTQDAVSRRPRLLSRSARGCCVSGGELPAWSPASGPELCCSRFYGAQGCSPPAGDAINAVVYGVNTEQPDTVLSKEDMNARKAKIDTTLLIVRDGSIKYVTSYLILKDGTSSEIRRDDLKPKPVLVGLDYIPLESSE